jgi:hypothetical protein
MGVLRSLPHRLQGYTLWAVFVDEASGLTQDRPPYDPWGTICGEHVPDAGGERGERKE